MKRFAKTTLLMIGYVGIFLVMASAPANAAVNVSNSPGWWSTCPRITAGPDGSVHVIWVEEYGGTSGDVFYSRFNPSNQTWSSPLNLSNSYQVYSRENRAAGIDSDASGNIYVSYFENINKKIKLRIFSGGGWGSPIDVATTAGDCDSVRVAVDSSGNIFLTWWDMSQYVCYSRARVNGNWEGVVAISSGGSKFPDIAVGDGVVFACWTKRDAVYQIYYTRRAKTPGAAWSPQQILSPNSLKQQVPAIEIDSSDIAHVVFTPVLGGGVRIVQYSYWTGNGFSSPLDLCGAYLLHYPALHERGDNIYCNWQTGGYESGSSINYNNRISETWQGEKVIPGSDGSTYCDVSTSHDEAWVYFVWDARGDIFIETIKGPGPTQDPRIPLNFHLAADTDGDYSDEVVADLGSSGVWMWDNGSSFSMDPRNPDYLIQTDTDGNGQDEIVVDFGGLGLRLWKSGRWYSLDANNPDLLFRADTDGNGRDEIVVDFGSLGLWMWYDIGNLGPGSWDTGRWSYLSSSNPDFLTPADTDGNGQDEIVVDFGGQGLRMWKSGRWHSLDSHNPDFLVRADTDGNGRDEIIVDFGSLGLWMWHDTGNLGPGSWDSGRWTYLDSNNPDFLASGDFDGDGQDEIAVDFGSLGLWMWDNGVWISPDYHNPDFLISADTDGNGRDEIAVDFGSLGLWMWDNGVWISLDYHNPIFMISADTDGDDRDEIVVNFGSLGLWKWNWSWTRLNFN